jgi:hypothetical protein
MPSKRTLIGAAAFSAALAGGGIAGAVLGTPGVSSAQDSTSTTQDSGTKAADAEHPGRPHPRLGVLREAAEALDMEPADLLEELRSGKSIADVAEEKGVDEQTVVDAIVSAGTERLEQAIEELPEHAKEAVEREGLPEGPRGPGGEHPRRQRPDAPMADGSGAEDAPDAS